MNAWQPKVSATQAGLLYCFEPIFASLYAFFLPAWLAAFGGFTYANEHLTLNLLIGGALIIVANVVIQFEPSSEKDSR